MSNVKYKSAIAAGIVAGSAVGVVTGLLIAPRSGKETREDIANMTKEGIETTKDKIGDMTDTVKDRSIDLSDKAKDVAGKAVDKVRR